MTEHLKATVDLPYGQAVNVTGLLAVLWNNGTEEDRESIRRYVLDRLKERRQT